MRIGYVGVDPSLTATGLAYVRPWRNAWSADTLSVGRKGITVYATPLYDRLAELRKLADEIEAKVAEWTPERICIESPAPGTVTSRSSGLSERGWLWCELAWRLSAIAPLTCVTTGQVKKYATGKGICGKGAVLDAVARRFPVFVTGGDDNRADAAVLAAIAADLDNCPVVELPKAHRDALAALLAPKTRKTRTVKRSAA
jgi:Holliday junction resolvasome RuvABC endonuclease subunit